MLRLLLLQKTDFDLQKIAWEEGNRGKKEKKENEIERATIAHEELSMIE